ncbi:MAG: hypothetical protein AB7O68_00690 [Pirellulales bacterium]
MDERIALKNPLVYDTGYFRSDQNRHAKWISVRIVAQQGLSAADEFYLWGLLALTFDQPQASIEFWATPHWCLKHLGCLNGPKGGRNYARFRQVLRRLAGTTYFCERFYDPIKQEERDRAFGLLKYDLPTRDNSSRAWRIVWDPLFFEYCQAKGGKLSFDLATYRALDPAARRLFLLLAKIFWRRPISPRFDVWHLAVHGLGFSPQVSVRDLKVKLARAIERLVQRGVVALPIEVTKVTELFEKKGTGSYAVQLQRGSYFDRPASSSQPTRIAESPLAEPLRQIGFNERMVRWILKTYRKNLIQVWTDITLAAMESKGDRFFTGSPQAYLVDNLKHASHGRRTPPDWWHDFRRRRDRLTADEAFAGEADALDEQRRAWEQAHRQAFRDYIETKVGKQEYDARVMQFHEIYAAMMPAQEALEAAIEEAEQHLRAGFAFPDLATWTKGRSADNGNSAA